MNNLLHKLSADCRCWQLEKLEYFQLLYNHKFEEFKTKFPDSLLNKFLAFYGHLFDNTGLKNELFVFYSGKHESFMENMFMNSVL